MKANLILTGKPLNKKYMKKQRHNRIPIFKNNIFGRVLFFFLGLIFYLNTNAQLFINGAMVVQTGETLYAADSIILGGNQSLIVFGTMQSTKGVNTNGNFIQTLNGGSIISPVASGVSKSFDIGTNSNNRIQILQNSGSTVNYKLNVSDNIHVNPQTKANPINTNVINKTWLVQPLNASNNTIVTMFWNATDELTGFNRTNCAISKWQENITTSWSFTTATSSSQTTGSSPSYSRAINSGNLATSVYYFGIGGSGSSLPITLLDFQVNNVNEDVAINWTTSSEINNSHFELQRSIDSKNWKQIAIVDGSGNSNARNDYKILDSNPYLILQVDKLFYRLKQVDFDENFSYSPIRNVNRNEEKLGTEINIYPNPTNNNICVHINEPNSTNYQIELIDIYGKTIKSSLASSGNNSINLTELPTGIYFIKVIDSQSKRLFSTNKILKN